jgi:hypothetical protein
MDGVEFGSCCDGGVAACLLACGCLKEESLAKPSFLDLKQMMIYQSTVAAWRIVESFCIC